MPGKESNVFGDSGERYPGEAARFERARKAQAAGRFADLTVPETERTLALMDAFGVTMTVSEEADVQRRAWTGDLDAEV